VRRENAREKGRRYVIEGRLILHHIDEESGIAKASCRGDGAVYSCGRDHGGWFCCCQARGPCSHLEALRLVVALEPRERRP
jgi:hypothetical protein